MLAVTDPLLRDAVTREEAEAILGSNLPLLKATAEDTLRSLDSEDTVTVELGRESYPTRTYARLAFPSGNYLSLRIRIGTGEGQNWWCVLFPPMCLSAASEESAADAFISVGFSDEQYRVITETDSLTYTARFKILEVFEKHLGS